MVRKHSVFDSCVIRSCRKNISRQFLHLSLSSAILIKLYFEMLAAEDAGAQAADAIAYMEEDCLQRLRESFGHMEFREGQWDAIASILNDRRDTFVSMPAASGKSLCYQFPSVFLDTITVVVSPLIAVMQDQVREMESRNLRGCYLGSSQEDSANVREGVIDGQYNIVYVTPEYITGDIGRDLLTEIRDRLTLIAIDEAYSVFKWGDNFRPEYAILHELRNWCPGVPILAVTGVGSPALRNDITGRLGMDNVKDISRSLDRPNLEFIVRKQSNNVPFLDRLDPETIWADIGPYIEAAENSSIIVECIHIPDTEFVASLIRGKGYQCAAYHSDVDLVERRQSLEDFLQNRTRIICGTVALGMSINKPDVHLVILYAASRDMYSCYLKFGNAGRDGSPSKCIMFYKEHDWHNLRYLRHYRSALDDDVDERLEALMNVTQDYVATTECRRRFILSYFGENCDELQARPDCCDNCRMALENEAEE